MNVLIAASALRQYDGQRSDDVQTVVWTLREPDGSERDYVLKLDEHSVLTHSIAFSVVDAQPPVPYSSKTVHVQCSPVTIAPAGMPTDTTSGGGAHSNCTFIQWGASFSSDATVEHLELMRNNIKSTFEDLNKAAMKHAATHASTNAGPNKGAGAALASKASSAAAQLSQNV